MHRQHSRACVSTACGVMPARAASASKTTAVPTCPTFQSSASSAITACHALSQAGSPPVHAASSVRRPACRQSPTAARTGSSRESRESHEVAHLHQRCRTVPAFRGTRSSLDERLVVLDDWKGVIDQEQVARGLFDASTKGERPKAGHRRDDRLRLRLGERSLEALVGSPDRARRISLRSARLPCRVTACAARTPEL